METLALGRLQHAEPGIADIGHLGGHLETAEIEPRGVIPERLRHPVFDQIDDHRGREDEAAMEWLQRKTDVFVRPDRRAGLLPDGDVFVVIELGERPRQIRRRRREGLVGQRPGPRENLIGVKVRLRWDDGGGR